MQTFAQRLNDRYRLTTDGVAAIDLQLKSPHQLFDERDPSPFRERDLDDDAARYIINSFRELPSDHKARLSLHFAGMGDFADNHDVIRKAIHSHFEYEAELKRRELRDTFKQGLMSLFIGMTFLLVCTAFSHSVHKTESSNFLESLLHEGLMLMGWVSMWKPINIFLYEWWPIKGSMSILRNLSRIEIEVKPSLLTHMREPAREKAPESRIEVAKALPLTNLKTS